MMKILTGLFALILVAGLLVACQNPSAAPSTPDPAPTQPTEPDPDADPDPDTEEMVTGLDLLSLQGWNRGAGDDAPFPLVLKISIADAVGEDDKTPDALSAQVRFTKDHRGIAGSLEPENGDGATQLCDLATRGVMVSGNTVSFSVEVASASSNCTDVFTAFDARANPDVDPRIGVADGDMIEVELTLTAPDTAVGGDKQKIAITGMVTITHKDDMASTADAATTATYMFTGEAEYTPPKVQPASN